MRLIVALALALALTPNASAHMRYPAIDAAIHHFAGKGVAHCLQVGETWAPDPHLGYDGIGAITTVIDVNGEWVRPGGYIEFGPRVCESIIETIANPAQWVDRPDAILGMGQQFLILAHEIGHMRGGFNWKSEAVIGCYGAQHVAALIRFLGIPEPYATTYAKAAISEYRLWPERYHLRVCAVPGGALHYPQQISAH